MKHPPLPPGTTPAAIARAILILRARGNHAAADYLASHLPPANDPLAHLGPIDQSASQFSSPNGGGGNGGSDGTLSPYGPPQPDNPNSGGSMPPKMLKAYDEPQSLAPSFPLARVPTHPEEQHDYSCVHLPIPEPERSRIIALGRMIPDDDLAPDGRDDDPHVTALYGLHTSHPGAVFETLKNFRPVKLKLGAVSVFSHPDQDVVKIEVESDALRRLNNELRHLPYTSKWRDFKPHITVAYVKPGLGALYALRFGAFDARCTAPTAVFSDPSGREHVYPLGRTIHVEKAAMSYLTGGAGAELVAPAGAAVPRKKKKRRRLPSDPLALACKAALAALGESSATTDFPFLTSADAPVTYPTDPELFIFGRKAQPTLFEEEEHPRESTAHGEKRAGEFAPKATGKAPAAEPPQRPKLSDEQVEALRAIMEHFPEGIGHLLQDDGTVHPDHLMTDDERKENDEANARAEKDIAAWHEAKKSIDETHAGNAKHSDLIAEDDKINEELNELPFEEMRDLATEAEEAWNSAVATSEDEGATDAEVKAAEDAEAVFNGIQLISDELKWIEDSELPDYPERPDPEEHHRDPDELEEEHETPSDRADSLFDVRNEYESSSEDFTTNSEEFRENAEGTSTDFRDNQRVYLKDVVTAVKDALAVPVEKWHALADPQTARADVTKLGKRAETLLKRLGPPSEPAK